MMRHETYMKQAAMQSDNPVQDIVEISSRIGDKLDMVNSPPHYNHAGIECIEAIEAALTPEEFRGYCKGNTLKYTWREKYKNGDQDLDKAAWYIDRLRSYKERFDES